MHWRAAIVRAGKWPYILAGIIGTLSGRKQAYSLTIKVRRKSKGYMLLVPHAMIVAVLALAWIIGVGLGRQHHVLLIAPVALIIVMSIGLMWTDTWTFPHPFELRLWRKSFTDHQPG